MATLEYSSPSVAVKVTYNAVLHRIAQVTVVATLLLIFMGGLVTSHGAGMSVPDWPNSYGYNMFTFPPSKWIGGIFFEHTHRLMATVVGLLSIIQLIVAWKVEQRRWVRWLTVGVFGLVILQGVFGGLRVVLVELGLAIVHACVAQAFLCTAALTAVVTSRWWIETQPSVDHSHNNIVRFAMIAVVVIYLQLIVGALMRHHQAGLAVPDLPLSYGHVMPPTDQQSLDLANQQRIDLKLEPVTLAQIWLHMGHRVGAIIVSLLLIALSIALLRGQQSLLQRGGIYLLILLATQLTLGTLTVLWRKPADIASLHVLVGALTLMTCFVIALRLLRLYGWPRTHARTEPNSNLLVPA